MTLEKIKLSQTRLALLDVAIRLDKIKQLMLSKNKVSKKEVLKIIDEEYK